MVKKIFYDLETTGLDYRKNGIHQIAGIVEIDDEIIGKFNFKTRPHPKAKIEPDALRVGGVTEEDIMNYPEMGKVYKDFIGFLSRYIDRYDKTDKAYLIGFNNCSFDDNFLRAWFEQNDDIFFGSWFYSGRLDAMILAAQYLIPRRHNMPSFQLKDVARELGLVVDESKLHDGVYDVELTRGIYRIVTNLELEL